MLYTGERTVQRNAAHENLIFLTLFWMKLTFRFNWWQTKVDFNFCLELQLQGSLASDEWLWVFVIGFVVYVLLCIVHRC